MTIGPDEIVLHHYDASPFSEKVRAFLGLKGAAWRSVVTPNMAPKPDLTPLTGGYRRAPVMQIGADIYIDSQMALAEIERRLPEPPGVVGPAFAINLWSDRLWFQTTVAVVFGLIGDRIDPAFVADREKLSGRPFDVAAMKAAATPMRAQWRGHAAWIEQALTTAGTAFLLGETPTLADVCAHMNIWWLGGAFPAVASELLDGFDHLAVWRRRIAALGYGLRSEASGAEALAAARDAEPGPAPIHDPRDPLGLAPGAAVIVAADDYGRDPIAGTLVATTPDRLVMSREAFELGRIQLHFPRVGYVAHPG